MTKANILKKKTPFDTKTKAGILSQFGLKSSCALLWNWSLKFVCLFLGIFSKEFSEILEDDEILKVNKSGTDGYLETNFYWSQSWSFLPLFWAQKLVCFVLNILSESFSEIMHNDGTLSVNRKGNTWCLEKPPLGLKWNRIVLMGVRTVCSWNWV